MILDDRTKKRRLLDAALLELRFKFKPHRVQVAGIYGTSIMSFIEVEGVEALESKYETENLDDEHEICYFVQKPKIPKFLETKIYYTVRQK